MSTDVTTLKAGDGLGELLHRISDDIKVLAKNELELARDEVQISAKKAAGEAAAIVLGGVVALIGLGMLCASAVVALDFLISSLALRLLLMAIVYMIAGAVVAGIFAKRLQKDIVPDTTVPKYEARSALEGIKHALKSDERPSHA